MEKDQKKVRVKGAKGVYYRESGLKRFNGKPDRCFYIAYRDSQQKLIWEKVGWSSEGYTAAMATTIRAERIRTIRHGEELPKKKSKTATLGDVWEKYDKWLDNNKRQPMDDRSRWRNHLEERFSEMTLDKISPFDLERLKSDLVKQGKSPATVKHVLVLVRQLYNKANAWGIWQGKNPIKGVKLPKLENRRERFLSYDEAFKLLDELDKTSPQSKDMALISLHCGLRAGEIFNLRWGHVDFNNNFIHVADSKSQIRKIPMTSVVVETFQERSVGKPEDFVFLARDGKKVDEISRSFERVINRLGWNNGITDRRQKVTFHTLRHTFASWLAIQGTPILTIKELLGHKTLAMTERYAHLIPDVKQEAVSNLERVFQASKPKSDVVLGRNITA